VNSRGQHEKGGGTTKTLRGKARIKKMPKKFRQAAKKTDKLRASSQIARKTRKGGEGPVGVQVGWQSGHKILVGKSLEQIRKGTEDEYQNAN